MKDPTTALKLLPGHACFPGYKPVKISLSDWVTAGLLPCLRLQFLCAHGFPGSKLYDLEPGRGILASRHKLCFQLSVVLDLGLQLPHFVFPRRPSDVQQRSRPSAPPRPFSYFFTPFCCSANSGVPLLPFFLLCLLPPSSRTRFLV